MYIIGQILLLIISRTPGVHGPLGSMDPSLRTAELNERDHCFNTSKTILDRG